MISASAVVCPTILHARDIFCMTGRLSSLGLLINVSLLLSSVMLFKDTVPSLSTAPHNC